jgi:hypothetical protein
MRTDLLQSRYTPESGSRHAFPLIPADLAGVTAKIGRWPILTEYSPSRGGGHFQFGVPLHDVSGRIGAGGE